MANIEYRIRLIQADGTDFSTANEADAMVKLVNSNKDGDNSGDFGNFTEVANGIWKITMTDSDSGYYIVKTSTDAGSNYSSVDGYNPFQILLTNAVDLITNQTIAGDKTFQGDNAHSGAESFSGNVDFSAFVDIAPSKLKIDGTALTVTAAEINKLATGKADGVVVANKALITDGSKNIDFGGGDVNANILDAAGILKLSGTESVNDNSDLDVTVTTTLLNSSTGALANDLPAGTDNQIKIIVLETAGNNAVITPKATFYGGTTITLSAVGDSVILIYLDDGWYVIGQNNVTIA